jgi:signal transduction histidine kinase/ABC-type amino acid transport substrate-binding protein/ActR/RegA family two-component response regulator
MGASRHQLQQKLFSLLALLLALCFTVSAWAAAANDKKLVRVGWYQAPGIQEGTDAAALRGFNYEYLGLIAQHTDWQYEFVFGNFDDLEQQLIQGKIDILGDVAKTNERLAKYNYCDYPSCYSRLLLVCRPDDDRFAYNDYASFNGIKVAISPSAFRRAMLNRRGAKYNFSVQFLEYPTDKEMLQALDRGEADAAAFSDAMIAGKYKIISKWEPAAQYFILTQKRPDLLREMNAAMDQIQSADRFIQERLFEKYFTNNTELITAFSRQELAYINAKPTVRVLMHVNDSPISYLEDGEPKGIAIDYLNYLVDRTGLKIQYIYYDTFSKLQEGLAKGDGDIYVHMPDNFAIGQKFAASLTQPYMVVRDGFVTQRGRTAALKTVAMVEAHPLRKNKLEARNLKVKEYVDAAACLDAVLANEVDAAVVDSASYNLIAYHAKYQNLVYQGDPKLEAGISFGVSNKSPQVLYSIIKKVTNDMTKSKLDNITIKNMTVKYHYTLNDYLHYGVPFIFIILLLILIVLVTLYVSKQKSRFNARLAEAKLQADQANESKSIFLSSMSHDLRTPLNGIIGYTALALQEPALAKKQEFLEKIQLSGNLLLDMVNDTLDLSRIESGKLVLEPEAVDGEKYWESIVTAMEPVAEVKQIKLQTDFTKYPHEMIMVDRVQVKKVLANILSNAIKYTPAGGTVTVTIEAIEPPENGCTRRIVVADTGIGMSREFITRMFEPFSQERRSEMANVTGTGLGLAIVKKIVDLMGGTIKVDSVLHQGTTFTVDLPIKYFDKVAAAAASEKDDGQKQAVRAALQGQRLLLCEDNHVNAEIAQLLLKNMQVEVDWALNGQEGVEKFQAAAPGYYAAVLMDIRMPVLDGLQATKAIRKLGRADAKTIPIIAMTVDAFAETIQAAKQAGMDAYVTKPVVPATLYQTIYEQLSKK